MKSFWNLVITLVTGLATWLAPLDIEPALKPFAAFGTTIGAGAVTAAYGFLGRDGMAARLVGAWKIVAFLLACAVCFFAYMAIRIYTFTETPLRYWSLALFVWVLSQLLAGLFSLIGMLAAERLNK